MNITEGLAFRQKDVYLYYFIVFTFWKQVLFTFIASDKWVHSNLETASIHQVIIQNGVEIGWWQS